MSKTNTNNAIVALHKATFLICTSLSNLESHNLDRTCTSAFPPSCYGLLWSPPNLSSGLAGRRLQQLCTHLKVHLSRLTHVHATCMLTQHTYLLPNIPFALDFVLCSSVSSLSPFQPWHAVRDFQMLVPLTLHSNWLHPVSQPPLRAGSEFTVTGYPFFLYFHTSALNPSPQRFFSSSLLGCAMPHIGSPVCNDVALRT